MAENQKNNNKRPQPNKLRFLCYTGRMPSGRVHSIITLASAPATAALALAAGATQEQALYVTAGHLSGLVVQPDLDLVSTIRIPVIGWAWAAYWWPYRYAMSHREAFSHAPLIGTLMRAGYIMPLWMVAWCIWPHLASVYLLWALGLVLPDILHAVADAFAKSG